MVSRRMASKFLGFDALKGMNEAIGMVDNNYINPVTMSDEDRSDMDLVLIRCFREKRCVNIKQYKKGKIILLSGIIEYIDMISHEVILTGKKRVPFESIMSLESGADA